MVVGGQDLLPSYGRSKKVSRYPLVMVKKLVISGYPKVGTFCLARMCPTTPMVCAPAWDVVKRSFVEVLVGLRLCMTDSMSLRERACQARCYSVTGLEGQRSWSTWGNKSQVLCWCRMRRKQWEWFEGVMDVSGALRNLIK